jgi:hypothetical protein
VPYNQYTRCVQPEDFNSRPISDAVVYGLFASIISIGAYVVATGGIGFVAGGIAGLLFAVTGLLSFVRWWLYGRLVCLGGDRCVIGMVVSVELPQNSTGFSRFDSDYSFNLLLPPHLVGATQAEIESDGLLGELIEDQLANRRPLPFTGEVARSCDNEPPTAVLHGEFEGAAMYHLYQWLKVLLGLLIVAAIASWLCAVPVIGWIACAIAEVLAAVALAALLGQLLRSPGYEAAPSDVNPELGGSLSTNGCDGVGADLLMVSGEWVYDSLHSGWNEIHPVRRCQRIGTWTGSWPFDVREALTDWCNAFEDADSPNTHDNQQRPEHHWLIHPVIDGCAPARVG